MILFLDFDGVLHGERCMAEDAFCRLPLVEEILIDFPQVQIVVSSAWRLDWPDEAMAVAGLQQHFSLSPQNRLVRVTPDFRQIDPKRAPDGLGAYLRDWECMDWMRKNKPAGVSYLMLDDRNWWFRPDHQYPMIVDGNNGFLPENEAELRARLKGSASKTTKMEVHHDHTL